VFKEPQPSGKAILDEHLAPVVAVLP